MCQTGIALNCRKTGENMPDRYNIIRALSIRAVASWSTDRSVGRYDLIQPNSHWLEQGQCSFHKDCYLNRVMKVCSHIFSLVITQLVKEWIRFQSTKIFLVDYIPTQHALKKLCWKT